MGEVFLGKVIFIYFRLKMVLFWLGSELRNIDLLSVDGGFEKKIIEEIKTISWNLRKKENIKLYTSCALF